MVQGIMDIELNGKKFNKFMQEQEGEGKRAPGNGVHDTKKLHNSQEMTS